MWAVAQKAQRAEQWNEPQAMLLPFATSYAASFRDQQAKYQQLPVQRTRKRNHKHQPHLST